MNGFSILIVKNYSPVTITEYVFEIIPPLIFISTVEILVIFPFLAAVIAPKSV